MRIKDAPEPGRSARVNQGVNALTCSHPCSHVYLNFESARPNLVLRNEPSLCPKRQHMHRSKDRRYSITSSPRASSQTKRRPHLTLGTEWNHRDSETTHHHTPGHAMQLRPAGDNVTTSGDADTTTG